MVRASARSSTSVPCQGFRVPTKPTVTGSAPSVRGAGAGVMRVVFTPLGVTTTRAGSAPSWRVHCATGSLTQEIRLAPRSCRSVAARAPASSARLRWRRCSAISGALTSRIDGIGTAFGAVGAESRAAVSENSE